MSRTDKTRPWWVKIQETLREMHDHRNGICDIAGVAPSRQNVSWRPRGACYYDGDWSDPNLRCCCSMCRYVWPDRRAARREGKRQTRDWWKE